MGTQKIYVKLQNIQQIIKTLVKTNNCKIKTNTKVDKKKLFQFKHNLNNIFKLRMFHS